MLFRSKSFKHHGHSRLGDFVRDMTRAHQRLGSEGQSDKENHMSLLHHLDFIFGHCLVQNVGFKSEDITLRCLNLALDVSCIYIMFQKLPQTGTGIDMNEKECAWGQHLALEDIVHRLEATSAATAIASWHDIASTRALDLLFEDVASTKR